MGTILLSSDIIKCRKNLEDVIIYPFDEERAKGIGYNFALSEFIYSNTKKLLVPIHKNTEETYFYIKPHETVLALSYECVKVSENIAGTFHSRVRNTAEGLGCISTTLDPKWAGMLLFSLNNPTNKKIKIVISKNEEGKKVRKGIVTLSLFQKEKNNVIEENVSDFKLDNPPMRLDILTPKAVKKHKILFDKRHRNFINIVNTLESFEYDEGQYPKWRDYFNSCLTDLEIAISNNDIKEINDIIIRIKNIDLNSIKYDLKYLNELRDGIVINSKQEYKDEYLNEINRIFIKEGTLNKLKKEIKYIIDCEQIKQINSFLSESTFHSSKHNRIPSILAKFRFSIGATVLTIISLFDFSIKEIFNVISINNNYYSIIYLIFVIFCFVLEWRNYKE